MNNGLVIDATVARRQQRAAAERARRAAMTPTQRALHLQRRRDRYRMRRNMATQNASSTQVPFVMSQSESVASLAATSLAAPSVFTSVSGCFFFS